MASHSGLVLRSTDDLRLSMRFSHEAVNHVVRVEVKSGHRAVRNNAPDRYFGPSQTRKTRWRSPHEASEAFPEQCFAFK